MSSVRTDIAPADGLDWLDRTEDDDDREARRVVRRRRPVTRRASR